ncbi:MAG TPA: outer membrane beta-barrel protein [Chitinophagaceae bacterium]|nr:outer membrane beta-barrel protein [Chitinophagaceae bacterium]
MRNKVLLVIIFFLSLQNLSAQVKGIIVDSAGNKPLENAIVGLFLESNKSDTSYSITNGKGEFTFQAIPTSNFSIIATCVGYKGRGKFRRIYGVEKTIDLGTVILVNQSIILDEIVINSPPISIKEDTIEYRADAFKVKENGVVEDLLKKLPGVQVDKNGNIKAQGKAITRVKVNGKDFFGGDPKTATKELPANIVDKIQIIDDYGDQATITGIKDSEPEKIMNIQIKKDKNKGYFGRATAGAGTKERYQASFNGNYFKEKQQISFFSSSNNTSQSLFSTGSGSKGMGNMMSMGQGAVNNMGGPGALMNAGGDLQLQNGGSGSDGITTTNSIGLNYRDDWGKKLTVYGSYSYSHRNNSGYKISAQQNIFSTGTFFNNQNNNFVNLGENHRFVLNIEYNIDSFNYIKINPSFSYGSSKGNSETIFDYANGNIKTSEGYYNTITNSNNPNFSGSVLYNHKFRKRGRNFSMNLNAGTSENNSDQDSRNYTVQSSPAGSTNLFLFNTQENDNHNYGVRFTYTEPLSKVRFLDVAFSHNLNYSKNNKVVYNVDPSTRIKVFNPGLSNDYENNYFNNRANLSIRTTEKKYNYTLGISVQPVNLSGISLTKDSVYRPIKRVNVFPVARFAYNFSKTQSLSFNYRGDAQQPGFTQLQDVLDSSNRQYQTKGNPNLKPSINHSVNLFYNNFNFTSGRVLFSSLSFSKIQNQIVNNTVLVGSSGAQLTTPENVNGYYNVSGFYNFSKPYNNRRYVISLNGILNFNHNINLVDQAKNIGKNWVVGQGVNIEFNHKEWLELAVGGNYNLNSITYSKTGTSNNNLQNDKYSTWNINSTGSMNIPKNWILRYDFDYTLNQGLTGDVGKNFANLNASIEKQLFKKKNGIIRLQGFDLFNQNLNISRSVNANSIIDSRTNRLNRYFMLTFTYRIQKFSGRQQLQKTPGNILRVGQ